MSISRHRCECWDQAYRSLRGKERVDGATRITRTASRLAKVNQQCVSMVLNQTRVGQMGVTRSARIRISTLVTNYRVPINILITKRPFLHPVCCVLYMCRANGRLMARHTKLETLCIQFVPQ